MVIVATTITRHVAVIACLMLLLLSNDTAFADMRALLEIEEVKGDEVEKRYQLITFNDNSRFRIDFAGTQKEITDETPYIMTNDGGESWVMADKTEDEFYCTSMKTDEFFKVVGESMNYALELFSVQAEPPAVTKTLDQEGPEIMGYKTRHIRVETTGNAYLWILFFKFEYDLKVVEDIWYTPELDIHPVRKKWHNALTQTGNRHIDKYSDDYLSNLPGPVLKSEMVVDIINKRKDRTKTSTEIARFLEVNDVPSSEMDKVFTMPECEPMDEDEVEERAKALFSERRLML